MAIVAPVNATVNPAGGPITLLMTITGSQLSTDASIVLRPPGPAPAQPLVTKNAHSTIPVVIPVPPSGLPGSSAECQVVITAAAANQLWGVLFSAVQDGATIGVSTDQGLLAAQADTSISVLTLVFT